jgi:hypothetical protein
MFKKVAILTTSLILLCGLVSACEEPVHTYQKVTPAVFSEIKTFIENYGNFGIEVPCGNSGDISGMGASAHFEYDGCTTLKIQLTKIPFFVSSELANEKLDKFIYQFI